MLYNALNNARIAATLYSLSGETADVVGAYDEVRGPVDREMLLELLEKDYQRTQKYWRDVSYTRDKYLEGYRAAIEAVANFTREAACDERDV